MNPCEGCENNCCEGFPIKGKQEFTFVPIEFKEVEKMLKLGDKHGISIPNFIQFKNGDPSMFGITLPCPLLEENGLCKEYDNRPTHCRIYPYKDNSKKRKTLCQANKNMSKETRKKSMKLKKQSEKEKDKEHQAKKEANYYGYNSLGIAYALWIEKHQGINKLAEIRDKYPFFMANATSIPLTRKENEPTHFCHINKTLCDLAEVNVGKFDGKNFIKWKCPLLNVIAAKNYEKGLKKALQDEMTQYITINGVDHLPCKELIRRVRESLG